MLACPACRDVYGEIMTSDPTEAATWLGIKARSHHSIGGGGLSSKDRDIERRRDKLSQRKEWKSEVNNTQGEMR